MRLAWIQSPAGDRVTSALLQVQFNGGGHSDKVDEMNALHSKIE
jgi:hypothetical protein